MVALSLVDLIPDYQQHQQQQHLELAGIGSCGDLASPLVAYVDNDALDRHTNDIDCKPLDDADDSYNDDNDSRTSDDDISDDAHNQHDDNDNDSNPHDDDSHKGDSNREHCDNEELAGGVRGVFEPETDELADCVVQDHNDVITAQELENTSAVSVCEAQEHFYEFTAQDDAADASLDKLAVGQRFCVGVLAHFHAWFENHDFGEFQCGEHLRCELLDVFSTLLRDAWLRVHSRAHQFMLLDGVQKLVADNLGKQISALLTTAECPVHLHSTMTAFVENLVFTFNVGTEIPVVVPVCEARAHFDEFAAHADAVDASLDKLLDLISLENCCCAPVVVSVCVAAPVVNMAPTFPTTPLRSNATKARPATPSMPRKHIGSEYSQATWQTLTRDEHFRILELRLGRSLGVVNDSMYSAVIQDAGWNLSCTELEVIFSSEDDWYG